MSNHLACLIAMLAPACTLVTDEQWDAATDRDGDGYTASEVGGPDCDDSDPDTYPGALERCDGVQNDCKGAWTSDEGRATFVNKAGVPEAMPERLSQGTAAEPASLTLTQAGSAYFCGGPWYVALELEADVTVAAGDPELGAILSGGDSARPISVRRDGISVTLQDLTLRDSSPDNNELVFVGDEELSLNVGGGLYCDAAASISLDGVAIVGNEAEYGSAVFLQGGCDLTATDSSIDANSETYAGGLLVIGASFTGNRLTVSGQESDYGGAFYLIDSTLTLRDATLSENDADEGGAIFSESSDLTVTDTTFQANGATDVYISECGGYNFDGTVSVNYREGGNCPSLR